MRGNLQPKLAQAVSMRNTWLRSQDTLSLYLWSFFSMNCFCTQFGVIQECDFSVCHQIKLEQKDFVNQIIIFDIHDCLKVFFLFLRPVFGHGADQAHR